MQGVGERCTSRLSLVLPGIALILLAGCSRSGSGQAPDVDVRAAAAYALEHYDGNKDGALEKSELSAVPALASALPAFDSSGNGRLDANEIEAGLTQMFASRTSLTEMTCTVTRSGRPLVGAKVRLIPLEMLGPSLPSAEDVTNESGTAHPGVSADLVPPQFKDKALMYPGLYRVEITHDQVQLPSQYNTETELGCQVNPLSRDGMSARFNLK
jgi:hypothetical protein